MRRQTSILRVCLMGLLLLPGSGCKDEPKAPADPLDDPWVDGIDEELGADEPAEVAAAKVEAPADAAPQAEPDVENDDPPAADEGAAEPEPAEEPTKEDVVAKAEARPEPAAKKPAASAKKPAKPSTPEPSPAEPAAPAKDANEEPEAETPPEAEPAPAVEPAPAPAPTKPPEPAPFTIADFNGKYRYVGGDRQRKALEQAIETAAEQLNVVIRKIGRKRLTETNPIDPSLEIIVTADKVKTIFSKSGFDAECKVDGPTISYTNKKGKKLKVRVRRSKNKLVQSIADSDGVKTTVFVLSKDRSRLTVHHKVTADRLDSPMTYKLSYARK